MINLLLDTNIAIDYLDKRPSYTESARKLMLVSFLGEFKLWMISSQITDLFYILTNGGRASKAQEVKERIKKLRQYVNLCSLTQSDVDNALASSWTDFEDACVYQCAMDIRADAIITRNKKDFEKSSIPVFDCDEWFEHLEKETGVKYEDILL